MAKGIRKTTSQKLNEILAKPTLEDIQAVLKVLSEILQVEGLSSAEEKQIFKNFQKVCKNTSENLSKVRLKAIAETLGITKTKNILNKIENPEKESKSKEKKPKGKKHDEADQPQGETPQEA